MNIDWEDLFDPFHRDVQDETGPGAAMALPAFLTPAFEIYQATVQGVFEAAYSPTMTKFQYGAGVVLALVPRMTAFGGTNTPAELAVKVGRAVRAAVNEAELNRTLRFDSGGVWAPFSQYLILLGPTPRR
jgi:hypothetical protein